MNKNWQLVPLDKAVQINPSVRLKKGKIYPFVSMQSVKPGQQWTDAQEWREFSGGGARFQHGDTLMARITPSLEHGKITRFRGAEPDSVGFGSTEFIVFRGRPGVTNDDFVFYLIKSPLVHSYAVSQMTGTSGRQRVPTDSLKHLTIPLPSLTEQKAIAHILGTLDDKIALNRRMNATLEAMARALFKAWFVDFEPVRAKMSGRWQRGQSLPGLPAHLYDLFPDRLVPSELGEIPEGWYILSLDEIATYLNGIAWQKYRAKEGSPTLPVIKIRELRDGFSAATNYTHTDVPQELIIQDGDIIFSWSGTLLVKIWTRGIGVLNQHLFKVVSDSYPKWFYYHWTLEYLKQFQGIASDKATTMGHIKRRHLSEAKVLAPQPELLTEMSDIMEPLLQKQIRISVESRLLTQLRDTLLPRLLQGDLEVPTSNDNPTL